MSDKLNNLKDQLKNACARFGEILKEKKNDIVRDSAIQRFEFTYELAWKTLQAYLKEKGVRVYTPRDAIKEAFQVGLIEDDPNWLRMIDTRNATSHLYNEAMADNVYGQLPAYYPLIKKLVEVL
ncbi:MAG: nucleotidyltransferase substrate binding protein [bacterium]